VPLAGKSRASRSTTPAEQNADQGERADRERRRAEHFLEESIAASLPAACSIRSHIGTKAPLSAPSANSRRKS